MIASMLRLDRKDIKDLKLYDAYGVHKMIYSLFPGDRRDFLYADIGGDARGRSFLILSKREPLGLQFGLLECKAVPDSFLEHDCYAFEVRLNPVKRITGSKAFIPIRGMESLWQWFVGLQGRWGFKVDEGNLEICDLGIQEFIKGGRSVIHNQATFKGILIVTDREHFKVAFSMGIGRGKAFGFGLLQLRPLKNQLG